jgi:hypothetical protein
MLMLLDRHQGKEIVQCLRPPACFLKPQLRPRRTVDVPHHESVHIDDVDQVGSLFRDCVDEGSLLLEFAYRFSPLLAITSFQSRLPGNSPNTAGQQPLLRRFLINLASNDQDVRLIRLSRPLKSQTNTDPLASARPDRTAALVPKTTGDSKSVECCREVLAVVGQQNALQTRPVQFFRIQPGGLAGGSIRFNNPAAVRRENKHCVLGIISAHPAGRRSRSTRPRLP